MSLEMETGLRVGMGVGAHFTHCDPATSRSERMLLSVLAEYQSLFCTRIIGKAFPKHIFERLIQIRLDKNRGL